MHHIEIVFNLNSKKELSLFLGLENRNLKLWYHDFLGSWEKLHREK